MIRPKNQVRELVKKWLESLENGIPHELEDALQHSIDAMRFETLSRRIVERYKNGSLSLHFHLFKTLHKGEVETQPNVAELCTVAQFIMPHEHGEDGVLPVLPFKFDGTSDASSEMETFVFVDVVEIIERSKRILPTMVRLQPLDQCHRLFGNTFKSTAFQGPRSSRGYYKSGTQHGR